VFAGRPEFGNYTDALGTAVGLEKYAGRLPAVLFALALLDASIIGAAAVSLATAYAIGDVFSRSSTRCTASRRMRKVSMASIAA
jgi:Mn2+/Fe2+ NRAMP family transporter